MKKYQDMVREFHVALNIPIGDGPQVREPELRGRLLLEEAKETADALERGDLVEVIDGLCDVIYVALGTAVSCGVDLEPFFAEVHRSNMAKVGGEVRADGKVLKPPSWTPPDIKGILEDVSGVRLEAQLDAEVQRWREGELARLGEAVSEVEVHPECAKMHRAGYCLCTVVQCIGCQTFHPPHKLACVPVRELVPLPKEEPKR